MTGDRGVEDLLRDLAPQVLGALVRRYGQFHLCEDASQEVGSSRVDLQACKLEYSIVSPK